MSTAFSLPAGRLSRLKPPARRVSGASLLVGAITLGALLLRLSQMNQSLFGDELWTYQQIAHHTLGQTLGAIHPGAENAPPLYFILAWVCAQIGDPTVWIRVPSLILGAATIPVVYALGRETAGRAAGVVGAAALALSPFCIYYGIQARPYATMAFFVALCALAAVHAVRSEGVGWWVLYVLAADAAAYSHYTAVFVLVALAGWTVWRCRKRVGPALVANACAVLIYLPWLPHLRSRYLRIIGVLDPFNVHDIGHDVLDVTAGLPLTPLRTIPTRLGLVVLALCLLVGLASLAYDRARVLRSRSVHIAPDSRLGLIVLLTAATPIGLIAYSTVSTDIWDNRNLYASVPALTVLLGALLTAIPKLAREIAVGLVMATFLVGTVRAISPSWSRPPLRAAADYLDRYADPRDPVVMYPSLLGGDRSILVELHRRHRIINGLPKRWPGLPGDESAFAVIDESFYRLFHSVAPQPRGLRAVARRRFNGRLDIAIVTYR